MLGEVEREGVRRDVEKRIGRGKGRGGGEVMREREGEVRGGEVMRERGGEVKRERAGRGTGTMRGGANTPETALAQETKEEKDDAILTVN